MIGGYVPVNPLNPQVVAAAQFAVDQLNALNLSPCYTKYTYTRVLKAYQQPVNGFNFKLEIEVATMKTGAACTNRFSDGVYSIRGVVVYQSFSGTRSLTAPTSPSAIQYVKENKAIGKVCSEPNSACFSNGFCAASGKCVRRLATGSPCDLSTGFDPCVLQSYCINGVCTFVQ